MTSNLFDRLEFNFVMGELLNVSFHKIKNPELCKGSKIRYQIVPDEDTPEEKKTATYWIDEKDINPDILLEYWGSTYKKREKHRRRFCRRTYLQYNKCTKLPRIANRCRVCHSPLHGDGYGRPCSIPTCKTNIDKLIDNHREDIAVLYVELLTEWTYAEKMQVVQAVNKLDKPSSRCMAYILDSEVYTLLTAYGCIRFAS